MAAAQGFITEGYRWVVDLDLEKFFDRVNHDILMGRIAKRINDPRLLRLIRAFLNAGVLEDGLVSPTDEGTPQGGPLSPLLSNIVLDDLAGWPGFLNLGERSELEASFLTAAAAHAGWHWFTHHIKRGRGTVSRLYSVVKQWFGERIRHPKHCLGAAVPSNSSIRGTSPPQSSGTQGGLLLEPGGVQLRAFDHTAITEGIRSCGSRSFQILEVASRIEERPLIRFAPTGLKTCATQMAVQ